MRTKTTSLFLLIVIVMSLSACTLSILPSTPTTVTPSTTSSMTVPKPSLTKTPLPTLSAIALENLYGDSSCSWPCWQGITPGITTSTEALQKINASPLVEKNSIQIKQFETGAGNAEWYWHLEEQLEEFGSMRWGDDAIIQSIVLGAYHVISLGEIIDKFGPPEKVGVMDCTEIVEGPQWWCATLFYPANGFEVYVSWERSGNEVPITPKDPVNFIWLTEPSAVKDDLLIWASDPQLMYLWDWKGYGDLLELYVP